MCVLVWVDRAKNVVTNGIEGCSILGWKRPRPSRPTKVTAAGKTAGNVHK